jgi:hypothetical protein
VTIQKIKLGRKNFVIVPERDFRRLQSPAEVIAKQDKRDVAEAKRREKEPSISLFELRKRLGI